LKLPSKIRFFRRLLFRKGYRVHSPFAFNLITKVIEEKAPYYIFDEIDKFRRYLKAKDVAELEFQHRNYGELLFRLVQRFECSKILQIRALTGVFSLYLSSALKKGGICFALEQEGHFTEPAKRFAESINIESLKFMDGDFATAIEMLKSDNRKFDLIFLNFAGDANRMGETFNLISDFIDEHTVLVVDGIAANNEMKRFWNEIKNRPETVVTFDLFALGLVFFDKKLNRQHYKTFFDYGKKQNLYPKRR